MPEGLDLGDGAISAPVYDDPDREPPASAEAPKGWAWQRKDRKWTPRQRGAVLWTGDSHVDGRTTPAGSDLRTGDTSSGESGQHRDPDPSWVHDQQDDERKRPAGKLKFDQVPQQVKDDVAGIAGLVGTPILAILQQADPYCGTILAQSFEGIVDATLPLICRSEKIVAYFSGDKSDWLLWGKLAMALRPFAQAVLQHHILRTVEVVRDDQGMPVAVPRMPREGHGDHLTPPVQPEFRYAA